VSLINLTLSTIKCFSFRITPIFTISSVTGKNMDLLTKFLNVLPSMKNVKEREKLTQDNTEFQVRNYND
jgi:GTPase